MSEQIKPQRTAQISPDRWVVGVFAVVLVSIIMIASMAFSYVAIAEAGAWAGVPGLGWIAPIFIDGAIIAYTVSLSVFEARRAPKRTIRFSRTVLWGFSLLSVVLNFAHTASFWAWDFSQREAWFGCLIAVSAPIAALLSAEEAVRLVFKRMSEPAVAGADAEAEAVVETAPEAAEGPDAQPIEAEVPDTAGDDESDAVAEAESILALAEATPDASAEDVDPARHSTIARYPAQGEFVTANALGDMVTDIDRPF